jgi:hypothetical protein
VADRDRLGEDAIVEISRILKRKMLYLRFDNSFPAGFDLADPFPKKLFELQKGHLVYVGPDFYDCLKPATWATRDVQVEGKTYYELTDNFCDEWLYSITPNKYVNKANFRKQYKNDEFSRLVKPFAHRGVDVADLLELRISSQAQTIVYEPGKPSGLFAGDRDHAINVYVPSDIRPRKGDEGPWIEFMQHLIPNNKDLKNMMRWLATFIAKPEIKMGYGVLLVSENQGVGKTTLAMILMWLIGAHNVSFPRAKTVTEGRFNSWIAFKRLAIISELYSGESARAYNELKDVIADDLIEVELKHETAYYLKNVVHIFASSNSPRALKISVYDRRWFLPEVTEQNRDPSYWTEFREWLHSSGLEIILWWAIEYVKQEGNAVLKGEHAPWSETKQNSIFSSMADGERSIYEFGVWLTEKKDQTKFVMRLDEFRAALRDRKPDRDKDKTERTDTIARWLRYAGLQISTTRFRVAGARFQVISNFEIEKGTEWASIKEQQIEVTYTWQMMDRQMDEDLRGVKPEAPKKKAGPISPEDWAKMKEEMDAKPKRGRK